VQRKAFKTASKSGDYLSVIFIFFFFLKRWAMSKKIKRVIGLSAHALSNLRHRKNRHESKDGKREGKHGQAWNSPRR
jgi:hypothetical protein